MLQTARPLKAGQWTESALKVMRERYLARDSQGVQETPEGMCWRVATAIAAAEARWGKDAEEIQAIAEEFYDLMVECLFLPNSPTLMNAGTNNGLGYSACFVLPVADSIEGIFDAVKHAALVHKAGGGTGFAFSRLRPKGSRVKTTNGVASGPVSFLRVFDAATEQIKQGGRRRGANMGILRVDHPDILEFIQSKLQGGITNFNISVAATEGFMNALTTGGRYDLIDPHSKEVMGSLAAREVFDLITRAAWQTGDPGMVFIDRINSSRANPVPEIEQIEATNPCGEQPLGPNDACFAPETRITTDRGLETVAQLYERQQRGEAILVATNLNGKGMQIIFRPAEVVKVGTKATVRVTLTNGQQLRVTPDHKILTQHGWKEAGTLTKADRVLIQTAMAGPLQITSTDGDVQRMFGWFTGDGWFTKTIGLTFGPKDELAFDRIVPVWRKFTGSEGRVQTQATMVRCVSTERSTAIAAFQGYGFTPGRGPGKRVPKYIFTAPKEEQLRYLQGLFGADGSKVSKKPAVALTAASVELLRDVQLLLLNLGMRSHIRHYPHRPTGRAWGTLMLSGESYHRFLDLIGFPLTPQKQERCEQFSQAYTKHDRLAIPVASVVPDSEVEVYDISEPVTHSLIAEGMIVHNCNLGSINLVKFALAERHTQQNGQGVIDWTELERVVRLAVRFLDDVIEVNPYPLPEIEQEVQLNRRIGLGVMGWADLLLELGIPYDSEEALALGDRVMEFIERIGHDESAHLAVERGPFPRWSQSIYRHEQPLRNSTVTTVAPTGTISIIAGCSSGIEPLFAVAFRHIVGERHLTFVNPQFEHVATTRGFYSEPLMARVAAQGTVQGLPELPTDVQRVFVTAHQIAPEWHVRMQAAFQRYLDNGCSKTINLPHSATVEDVGKAYLLAYELGCLGITVFRDGSKADQVLHMGTGNKDSQPQENENKPLAQEAAAVAPALPSLTGKAIKPRPRKVQGVTYRAATPLGTAFITVNINGNGEPFEVFANVGKAGSDTASVSEAMGRLISLALRLPSPLTPTERLREIVGQLQGIGGGRHLGYGPARIRSLPDAIAQVLAEHLGMVEERDSMPAQPMQETVGDLCPDCGQGTLVFEEGCQKCYSCGYSEC